MLEEIEAKLDEGDIIGAFGILQHWYRKFTGRALKSYRTDLDRTRYTYVKLFKDDDFSDDQPFDFEYDGDQVKGDILDKEEIRFALFKMQNRKAPGLTWITVDVLKIWYRLAHPEKKSDAVAPSDAERW